MKKILIAGLMALHLSACVTVPNQPPHVAYGKILSVAPRQVVEQQANLLGAAVGGVAGGVVGHQFGKGNGKTALTLLGAVAGAAAGSQVGQNESVRQVADLTIQMADGKIFTITTSDVGFRPGQHVRIVQQGRQASVEAIQ